MPTFAQDVIDRQIIIGVEVSLVAGQHAQLYSALLDTGAQRSAISPQVVSDLGLVPIAPFSIGVASGESIDTYLYHARVDIPIGYTSAVSSSPQRFRMGQQLSLAGLPYRPRNYDVILGMDFIGGFHLTLYQNRIILSN